MSRTSIVTKMNDLEAINLYLQQEKINSRKVSRQRSVIVKSIQGSLEDFNDWITKEREELIKKHAKHDKDGNVETTSKDGQEIIVFKTKEDENTFLEEFEKVKKTGEKSTFDTPPSFVEALRYVKDYLLDEENDQVENGLIGEYARVFDMFIDFCEDIIDGEDDPSDADKKKDEKKK